MWKLFGGSSGKSRLTRAERLVTKILRKARGQAKIVRAFTSMWENSFFMFSNVNLDKKSLDEDGLFSHNFGYDFAFSQA